MGSGITPSPPEPGIETVILCQTLSGAEGDRTLNLSIANAALSQLSYRPIWWVRIEISVEFSSMQGKMRFLKGRPGILATYGLADSVTGSIKPIENDP